MCGNNEWRSYFLMPANNLQFTANFRSVNSTLTYEKIRGKNNLKDVYYVFPINHKGIIYLFHGSNGSTSSWTGNQENKNLIKDLIADGYAVVITESEEETLNTDINGDGSLRWDASTLDSNLNVDFANLKAITDTFYNRGYTYRGINRYCLGQSNGGSFSISFGYYFNLKACIAYCSSGGATGGAVNITNTPTLFCLQGADNNTTMGLTGNANAISNSQSISSRGVCSKYHTNNPSPLYDQRFARNSIISSSLSTQIFNEIKNNNFLNTKNYFIGYIQSLWNAVTATPQNFPVISVLSNSQKNVIEEQIRCVTADHQFYSEFNKSSIQFLNYQCQPQYHTTSITQCDSYSWPVNGITYTTSGSYTSVIGCHTEILNLTINLSTHNKTTASSCTSYTWSKNAVTYSASGNYIYTYTNSSGCASADTLKLTIQQKTSSVTTISNCVSYLWNGVTYTASGTYTKLFTNAAGCDSTAVLNLSIKQPTSSSTVVSNCVSYLWSGVTYTASGTYTKINVNSVGCDSTAILSLTIKVPTYSSQTTSSCETYTWSKNGIAYTSSGIYVYNYTNNSGCASSDTLKLTIKNSTTSSFSASGCNSYVLPWGTLVTTTGQYTYNYTSTNGCDSVVTVNITINQSKISNTNITLCTTQLPYLWNGTNYTSSGSYTYNTTTTQVCDSVAVLNLTVKSTSSSTTNVSACNSSLPYYWNGTAYTSGGTYSKLFTNALGCDSTAILVLTVSTTTPGAPTTLTQTLVSNVCGARIYRYTVTAVTNATGYSWTLPASIGGIAGVVVDSGDANASRVIRIKYTSNAAALTTDSIFVRAFSGCGVSATKSFKLTNTVLTVPAAPASITITAIQTNVCGNKIYRYTSPALPAASSTATAATGYVWSFVGTLGTNAVIDSGSLTSRIVRMKFMSNAAAATGDSARVLYTSACGNSLNKALKLTNTLLNVPAAPASITVTAIQTNVCGSRVYRYTAPTLPAATTTTGEAKGYLWSFTGSLGANAVIDSGSTISSKIVVRYSSNVASAVGDSVKVLYTSDCGNSLNKALKLTNTALVAPTPASITMALVSDVCGARVYRYTAPATAAATSTAPATTGWQWSMPIGVVGSTGSLDSGTLSSQIIKIRYTSNAAAGTGDSIKVAYVSACGVGANKVVKLSNAAKTGCPVTPVTLPITNLYFLESKKYLVNLR